MITTGINHMRGDKVLVVENKTAKIWTAEYESYIDIRIPSYSDVSAVITVYKPETRFGRLEPARVNWGGCGSQSAEISADFAAAMQLAVYFCNQLNAGNS